MFLKSVYIMLQRFSSSLCKNFGWCSGMRATGSAASYNFLLHAQVHWLSITETDAFRVMCIQILLSHCSLFYRATAVSLLTHAGHFALPAKHQGMQFYDRKGQTLFSR